MRVAIVSPVVLGVVLSLGVASVAESSRDLSDTAKRDAAFLVEHDCLPGHFRLKDLLIAGELTEVVTYGKEMDASGYHDRFVLEMVARAHFLREEYQAALNTLERAINTPFRCQLTRPTYRARSPDAVADAITLYHLAESAEALDLGERARAYTERAMATLHEVWVVGEGMSESDFPGVASRVLERSSLTKLEE